MFLAIALNRLRTARDFHQADKRDVRRTRHGNDLDAAPPSCRTMDESRHLLELVVTETLERLPPPQRRVVELRFAGHEVAEIAEQIGRSMRTTERLLQEARDQFKALYGSA